MRYILIFLVFVSLGVNAQDTTKLFKSNDYGWQWKRGKFDSMLMLPKDTVRNKLGIAALNGVVYQYTNRWVAVGVFDTTSLSNRINLKLNIADTTNMLANYKHWLAGYLQSGTDISVKSVNVTGTNGSGHIHLRHQATNPTAGGQQSVLFAASDGRLKYKNDGLAVDDIAIIRDTATTLATKTDLTYKLNISDTGTMLSRYLRKTDTTTLSNRINTKLNIFDTSSMLSPYLRKLDTATLSNRINTKLNISDTANMRVRLFAGSNITLSGSYPSITVSATAASDASKLNISDTLSMLNNRISSIALNTSGILHTSPVTFNRLGGAWSGSLALANQSPFTILRRGSGTGTPSFGSIDSSYFGGLFRSQVSSIAVTLSGNNTFTGWNIFNTSSSTGGYRFSVLNSGLNALGVTTSGQINNVGWGNISNPNTNISMALGCLSNAQPTLILARPNNAGSFVFRVTDQNAASGTNYFSVDNVGNTYIGSTAQSGTDALNVAGNLSLMTAGNKIKIATGTNASAGTATLSGGTITVNTTAVTASSLIYLTLQNCSTCGTPYISARTAGTSFTISSTNVLDASQIAWLIIN